MNYNYPKIKGLSPQNKQKLYRAMLYDFIKKNHVAYPFMDVYRSVHDDEIRINRLGGINITKFFLDRASYLMAKNEVGPRDVFYNNKASFKWGDFDIISDEIKRKFWQDLDKRWYTIIDAMKHKHEI